MYLDKLVPTSVFFLHLFQREPLWISCRVFMGQMPFLSTNHQC